VNTPVGTHFEYAKKVLAGKHHSRKSIYYNCSEAQELAALAKENA
jgi:predicted dehydrogenase